MFAFILEELRDWREKRLKRTVVTSALTLAAVAAASMLNPLIIALTATILYMGFAWSEGNHYQSSQSSRRLLLSFPVPSRAIAAAKALSSLVTWSFTTLLLSPPLVLSALAWGVSDHAIVACILSWLVIYYAMLCAGFFSGLVFEKSDGIPGILLIAAWLVSSFVVKALSPSNPFIQIWRTLKDQGGDTLVAGMGGVAMAGCVFLVAAALALARIRRWSNE